MLRLKNRSLQIPGGYRFYLPELKWTSSKNYPSFDRVVMELTQVIHANPHLAQKHRWPTDRVGIENWVDLYNATVCAKMGWDNYLLAEEADTIPKPSAPHQQALLQNLAAAAARAKELVRGAKTIGEWVDSGDPAVAPELSSRRASICSNCPKNEPGDFTKWFTVPAAELIRRQVQKLQSRQLSTPRDGELNICVACHCPLQLKVHMPIDWVIKRLSEEQRAALKEGKDCWILSETGMQ